VRETREGREGTEVYPKVVYERWVAGVIRLPIEAQAA